MGRQANPPPSTSKVAIRSVVYLDESTSVVAYKTESTSTIKNFDISMDISLGDLRDRVAATLCQKSIECDHIYGKLFYASAINGLKMLPIRDATDLSIALNKGTGKHPVHLSLGARCSSSFAASESLPASQNSGGSQGGLRDPPPAPETKSAKQSARVNVDKTARVRAFVDALYGSADSPFYHGFTSYHYGVMQQHLKTLLDSGDESLFTDVEHGVFPLAEDWDKFSPDKTWDTPQHQRLAAGVSLSKGMFKPKDGTTPPPAFWCKQLLESKKKNTKDMTGGTSGVGGTAASETIQERILNQMVNSNTMLMQASVAKGVMASPMVVANPVAGEDNVMSQKKRKIQFVMDETIEQRKKLLEARYGEDTDQVKVLDARVKKCLDAIEKIRQEEDRELFADL